jgi:glycosyltransferase involved in cell wall biosynthesis
MLLSVVAPVCNEGEVIDAFHRRVRAAVEPLGPYELILVDDGSTDNSWDRMLSIAAGDPAVRLVRLSRNFGHQLALTAGLDEAHGDAVVTIDSDLQDPPELIPELVQRWRQGYDVVYAVRSKREGERRWRLAGIGLYYRLQRRIAGTKIPEQAGDFRLYSRRAVDSLRRMPERARYLRGMSTWIGFRQIGVAYRREPRLAGETKYPLPKLVRLGLDGILSFSTLPLKFVSLLGFSLVVFCVGVLAWSLYTRLFTGHHPQGWTSVIAVVLLLGGVQLLSLGIIGQYVARIFDEAKQRPLYLVDEIVEGSSKMLDAPGATPAADDP